MNNKNTGDIIDTLFTIVEERKKSKKKGSYTSFLFNKGMNKIAQKVSEETAETIIEALQGKKKLAVQESCDLLYHLIVMWSKLGVKPEEICIFDYADQNYCHRKDRSSCYSGINRNLFPANRTLSQV